MENTMKEKETSLMKNSMQKRKSLLDLSPKKNKKKQMK